MTATATLEANEGILLREDRDGVATLTLNRPKARNALSRDLMAALQEAVDAIAGDPAVRVVVIAANGPAFSAGHDLREIRANPEESFQAALFEQCSRLMLSIMRLPQPVIARVHAPAFAAGAQLVATCDLAVSADSATFCTPGVHIGLFCSTPMVAVGRNVGRKRTMEMLLTGDPVPADEALRLGLLNRVVPADELDAAVDALARKIMAKSPLVLRIGKEAFYRQAEVGVDEAYAYTAAVMTRNMMTDDAAEGIDAFLEKREPQWTGT